MDEPTKPDLRIGYLEHRSMRADAARLTELFERYQRSEKALVGALAEMYVQGVSTRKVAAAPAGVGCLVQRSLGAGLAALLPQHPPDHDVPDADARGAGHLRRHRAEDHGSAGEVDGPAAGAVQCRPGDLGRRALLARGRGGGQRRVRHPGRCRPAGLAWQPARCQPKPVPLCPPGPAREAGGEGMVADAAVGAGGR